MFKIKWEEKDLRFLDKLNFSVSRRIIKKVDQLKEDPFSKDIKKLRKFNLFGLRVGDYRVFFEIIQDIILILKIGHRKSVYKN